MKIPSTSFTALRVGLGLLLGVIVLWVAYVIAMSVWLPRRLSSLATATDVVLDQERATSWYPGEVTLHDVTASYDVHYDTQQWRCQLSGPRITLQLGLAGLWSTLLGDAQIRSVRGGDLVFSCTTQPTVDTAAVGRAPRRGDSRSPPWRSLGGRDSAHGFSVVDFGVPASVAGRRDARDSASSLWVDEVHLGVSRIALDDLVLRGPITFVAESAAVRDGAVEAEQARLRLQAATLEDHGDQPPATIAKQIVAEVQLSTRAGESAVNSPRVTAAIERLDWVSYPRRATTAGVELDAHVSGRLVWEGPSWQQVRLSDSSTLRIDARHARLNPSNSAALEFVNGFDATMSVATSAETSRPATLEWALSAPRVARREASGDHQLVLEDVELMLSGDAAGLPGIPQDASLRLQAGSVKMSYDEQTIVAEHASLQAELEDVSAAVPQLNDLDVELEGGRLARLPGSDPQFRLELELAGASDGVRRGSARARGDDAGVLLSLANVRGLPTWISSKFRGQPFALSAIATLDDQRLVLSELHMERGAITLRGWLALAPGEQDGALLMEYGGLAVGIDAGRSEIVTPAPVGWLAGHPAP